MVELASIEAVRAVQAPQSVAYLNEQMNANRVADPEAVAAFEEAMCPQGPDPVPFAQQVSEAWRSAQDVRSEKLKRIESLISTSPAEGRSADAMLRLQYELINFGFQQEVVSDIAKKASTAIETLIKNG